MAENEEKTQRAESPPIFSNSLAETESIIPRTTGIQDGFSGTQLVREGDILSGQFTYRVRKKLGEGGFGTVFVADRMDQGIAGEEEIPSEVAIKCFIRPRGRDVQLLFKRELSALLPLRQGPIPRVLDWGSDGELAFVVLEYFRRGNLYDGICQGQRLSVNQAWRLMTNLLEALTVAHRANILHLDIKPANVLIGDHSQYLLTDFGISQGYLVTSSVVMPGIGSRGYRAPEQEQFCEEEISAQTDLWAVGTTVWSAFTGLNLSDSKVLEESRPPEGKYGLIEPCTIREDCPPELNEVIMSLLANDPADRPGSAAEVLNKIMMRREGNDSRFGVDAILQQHTPCHEDIEHLLKNLIDPLWVKIFAKGRYNSRIICFQDGEYLCRQGEKSYYAFILLKGKVAVEIGGKVIARESREGTFLGEVSTLTGLDRTASMYALGPVWVCVLNAAQLEKMVMADPAIGIRLIKSLAERVSTNRRNE